MFFFIDYLVDTNDLRTIQFLCYLSHAIYTVQIECIKWFFELQINGIQAVCMCTWTWQIFVCVFNFLACFRMILFFFFSMLCITRLYDAVEWIKNYLYFVGHKGYKLFIKQNNDVYCPQWKFKKICRCIIFVCFVLRCRSQPSHTWDYCFFFLKKSN